MPIVLDNYRIKNTFKYGLKISSPFADEFEKVVAGGGEIIEVKAGTTEIFENDLSRSRLLIVRVNEDAIFEYRELCNGMASAKNDIHIILSGAHAKASIVGRYNLTGESKLDIYHKVYNHAPNTISRIDARGVLCDQTHLIYRSDIEMKKGMNALSGAQDGKFLVLSKEAKIDAIPSLDIASRNVSCSHSLSITHITPEDLFYSKTRGMGEEEARKLLISGFLGQRLLEESFVGTL